MDKRAGLSSVFVFSGLDEAVLSQLSARVVEVRVAARQILFREGEQADSFYVIDTGEVTIARRLGTEQEKILSVLGPGNVFGEMAFCSESPRTADAAAKSDSTLWKIGRADFAALIANHPEAGLRILSRLMQVTMGRLEQTSRELSTVYQTGKIIASGRQLNDIVGCVREEIRLALPESQDGAVYLYNEFNQEFDPAAAPQGMKEIAEADPVIRQLSNSVDGLFPAAAEHILWCRNITHSNAQSVLFSPIRNDKKLFGFILVWDARQAGAFTNNHALLVASVAGQLASAIENIRFQQEEHDRRRLNNARLDY
jgi:CRP-like cAMP-binding protein